MPGSWRGARGKSIGAGLSPRGPPHLVPAVTDWRELSQNDGQPQLEGTGVAIWPSGFQTHRRGRDLSSDEITGSKNRYRRLGRGWKSLGAPGALRGPAAQMETEDGGGGGAQPLRQGQGLEPGISDSKCGPQAGATWGQHTAVLATRAARLSREAVGKPRPVAMENPRHSGYRECLPPKGWTDLSQDFGGHRRSRSQEA